jgi:hypothetical protein
MRRRPASRIDHPQEQAGQIDERFAAVPRPRDEPSPAARRTYSLTPNRDLAAGPRRRLAGIHAPLVRPPRTPAPFRSGAALSLQRREPDQYS